MSLTQAQRNALVRVSVYLPQDIKRLRLVGRYVPMNAVLRIADKPKKVKR